MIQVSLIISQKFFKRRGENWYKIIHIRGKENEEEFDAWIQFT